MYVYEYYLYISIYLVGNLAEALNVTKGLYEHRPGAQRALIAVSDGLDPNDVLSAGKK
jgi:hypothetical protein